MTSYQGSSQPTPPPSAAPSPPPRQRDWVVVGLAIGLGTLLVLTAVAVPFGVNAYRAASIPTLEEVRVFEDLRTDHSEDDLRYDPGPPAGGPHAPEWLECGVYSEPVREENTVHSLEHGTVWVTYDPERVDEAEVGQLADQLPEESIVSPYPGQDAPVIVTVWARQLPLDGADDARLELFLAEYGDGHTAPEPMASCAGGVERTESDDASGGVDV